MLKKKKITKTKKILVLYIFFFELLNCAIYIYVLCIIGYVMNIFFKNSPFFIKNIDNTIINYRLEKKKNYKIINL